MATIQLKVRKSGEYQVEVQTIPAGGNQPDHNWGNVETTPGTRIKWDAKFGGQGNPSQFTVRFRYVRNGTAAWPFVENADGTGVALPTYVGPLVLPVNGKNSVELTTKNEDLAVKYDVVAEPSATIEALDPMIIIRPASAPPSDGVLLGTVCAVLGAVAGAVACALLS